jgi:hypothetical protein
VLARSKNLESAAAGNGQPKRGKLTNYPLSDAAENPWKEIPFLKKAFIPSIGE